MAKDTVDTPQLGSSAVISLPQPPLRKTEEYLKAYTTYTFTAISAIAQEVGSIDLHLFTSKYVKGVPTATEVYEHEVLSLLHYINPLTTFYDMVEATQIYLELTGEAFWVVLKQGMTPREMWLLRPDWVSIVPSKDKIIDHYVYHPGGSQLEKVDIPKENIIHFKYFNPLNPYRGKGSVQAAALPLDIHTFAQEWNRNFFFNSAIPGLVFSSEKPVQEKVIQRFLTQWQSSYSGRGNTNKIAFLGGGMKLDKVTTNAQEMDFAEQQKMMRDDILAVFKVPKTILGLTDDVNRANAEATTRAFMERVVTPRMKKFVGCLNEFLLPMYGDESLFFDFTDPAPADTELMLRRYENARRFTWMTPNEIRAEQNLKPIEGGDDLFAPLASSGGGFGAPPALPKIAPPPPPEAGKEIKLFGFTIRSAKHEPERVEEVSFARPFKHMMPLPVKRVEAIHRETIQRGLTKDVTELIMRMIKIKSDEDLVKEFKKKKREVEKAQPLFNEETKLAYWKQFIKQTDAWTGELKDKAVEIFKEQERIVLDNIDNSVKYWKPEVRKGKESSVLPSEDELDEMWTVGFMLLIREILIEQGDYTLDFLGVGGHLNLGSDAALYFLQTQGGDLIHGINSTTRDQLRTVLSEGFGLGEGIDSLKARVEEVFKEATSIRAEMIARTESLRASNFATVEAYEQSDVVEAMAWLCAQGPNACETCLDLDGTVVDLGQGFGEVDFPPLHPNCECTTIPILIGEKKV